MTEGELRVTSSVRERVKCKNKSRPGTENTNMKDTNMKAVGGRKKLTKVVKEEYPESKRDWMKKTRD